MTWSATRMPRELRSSLWSEGCEWVGTRTPLLAEEGWLRHQENAAKPPKWRRRARSASAKARSFNSGQFGATTGFRRSDHPVRSNNGSFAIFLLMSRPPLLCEEGNSCLSAGELVKVAVIGVGHVGKEHARILSELPDVELAAVVDVLRPRAEEVAALYATAAFTDYRELLGKVDAATLAVPTLEHARIGIDLLEHGIDVLVEKPIAADLEEGRALIDRALQNNRVLQVGHVERF